MLHRWPAAAFVLAILVGVTLGVFGGHIAATSLIRIQQDRHIAELAQLTLRRAEAVVDQGGIMLDDLLENGLVGCDPVTIQRIRFSIYRSGQVKDIRMTGNRGAVKCSAFPETLEFDRTWPAFEEMLPGREGGLRLFRVDQFSGEGLGVLKPAGDDTSIVAVVAFNTSILDVMPGELRDRSQVTVSLGDGAVIARLNPGVSGTGIKSFPVASARYPLESMIEIPEIALIGWNSEIYLPVVALAAGFGLVLGIVAARAMTRSETPLEALDKGIAAREFVPWYQPVYDLTTGRITSCEMLARWIRPGGETIPPVRFIPLAEETGRIEAITWQLLDKTLTELNPLLAADKNFLVAINISPRHFMAPAFAGDLKKAVARYGVARRQVCVEITEREPFDDLSAAARVVAQLQEEGFKVSIDDVGIGHSGLSHLQALRANTLKIDKFFVDSIGHDETALSIIEMLVRLGKRLNMQLVAEGIEHPEQAVQLQKCGVHRGQGYAFAPPLDGASFKSLVEKAACKAKGKAVSSAA